MRIFHISAYYPPHLGGMENYIQKLAELQVKAGHTVCVLTSNQGSSDNGVCVRNGVKIHYLDSIEIAHTPLFLGLLPALWSQPRESIFHIHVSQAFVPEATLMVAWLKGIPYVAQMHLDVDPSGVFGFLLKPYKQMFLRPVLHRARRIICATSPQKQLYQKKYDLPAKKISVIPNAVGKEFFVHQKHQKRKARLLYVGRLASQKRVHLLLEAKAMVKHEAILDIIGAGEEADGLRALATQLGLKQVHFRGQLTGSELINYYRQADIFLMASKREGGCSLAMLEAMAAGIPIVAVDSPGMTDQFKNVFITTKADAKHMAWEIDRLLENPIRRSSIGQKERLMAKDFSWERLSETMMSVYQSVI